MERVIEGVYFSLDHDCKNKVPALLAVTNIACEYGCLMYFLGDSQHFHFS